MVLSNVLCMFVNFLSLSNVTGERYSCGTETFTVDDEWLCHRAIKFAEWQHPAVGHVVRFVVHSIICFS